MGFYVEFHVGQKVSIFLRGIKNSLLSFKPKTEQCFLSHPFAKKDRSKWVSSSPKFRGKGKNCLKNHYVASDFRFEMIWKPPKWLRSPRHTTSLFPQDPLKGRAADSLPSNTSMDLSRWLMCREPRCFRKLDFLKKEGSSCFAKNHVLLPCCKWLMLKLHTKTACRWKSHSHESKHQLSRSGRQNVIMGHIYIPIYIYT